MKKIEFERLRKMFLIGIIFSVVTVIGGEMPIGWNVYPEAENELISNILGFGSLSMAQLACGVLFGSIGIPLQYYGYKSVGEITAIGGSKKCCKVICLGAKAIAFWGAIVHVICVALMFVCRMDSNPNMTEIPQNILDFMLWLVLPIIAVFMVFYIPMTVAMIIPVIKGKTIFPKWAVIFNPIFFMMIIGFLPYFAPNTEFVNGIRMSNMGIGSLVTFVGLLILLNNYFHSSKEIMN